MLTASIQTNGREFWPLIYDSNGVTLYESDYDGGRFATYDLALARAKEFLAAVPGGDKAVWPEGLTHER